MNVCTSDDRRYLTSPDTIIQDVTAYFTQEEFDHLPLRDQRFLKTARPDLIRKYLESKKARAAKAAQENAWKAYVQTGRIVAITDKASFQHSKLFSPEELPLGFFKTIEFDFFEKNLSVEHGQFLESFKNSNKYNKLGKRYFKLRTTPPEGTVITPLSLNRYGYLGIKKDPDNTAPWASNFINGYLLERLKECKSNNTIIQPFLATSHIMTMDQKGGGHLFIQENTKRMVPGTLLRNLSSDVRFALLFALNKKDGSCKFEEDLETVKTKPSAFFPQYINNESNLLKILHMSSEVGQNSFNRMRGSNAFLKKIDKQQLIDEFKASPTTEDLYIIFYISKYGHLVKSAFPLIHMFEFDDALEENIFSLQTIGGKGAKSFVVNDKSLFTNPMFTSEEFSYYCISKHFLKAEYSGIYVKVRNTAISLSGGGALHLK